MREPASECWACDSTDVTYTDAIGCGWCEPCFRSLYLQETCDE